MGSYNSLNRLTAIAQKPSEPLEPEEKWEQATHLYYTSQSLILCHTYPSHTDPSHTERRPNIPTCTPTLDYKLHYMHMIINVGRIAYFTH